ncbi:MAG: universal stress protein [Hyphomicrobiaceae bacterium]|nr:universal stress protein [Hyphomicrobiaceae bacterium]
MKAILVPTDQSEIMPSVLASAELLAHRCEALVEGVALRPVHVEIVAPDPIVAVTFPPADWNDAEFVGKARATFEARFRNASGLRYRWRAGPSIDDAELGSLARVYDIVVVGRPSASGRGPRMTTLESALFESGQSVLVTPPSPPKQIGENVLISWNCSTEQARATASAIPLLRQAKAVTIITIEGLTVAGPTGQMAQDWLAAHGINAREVTMGNGGRKPGEVLLTEAEKLGADLIVKGAYTQSRLRQMIFGGATSHLLAHSSLPMLMAR